MEATDTAGCFLGTFTVFTAFVGTSAPSEHRRRSASWKCASTGWVEGGESFAATVAMKGPDELGVTERRCPNQAAQP